MEQQEIERRNLAEYKSKLIIGDTTLPDPLSMKKNNWIGEKEGILIWASVYIMDISKFFENVVDSSDLIHRLRCEYIGKERHTDILQMNLLRRYSVYKSNI